MSEISLADSTRAVPRFSDFFPKRAVTLSRASTSFDGACLIWSTTSVRSAWNLPPLLESLRSPWALSRRSPGDSPLPVRWQEMSKRPSTGAGLSGFISLKIAPESTSSTDTAAWNE